MDTNDDQGSVDLPRPDAAQPPPPPAAAPFLPPPASPFAVPAPTVPPVTVPLFTGADGEPTATVVPDGTTGTRSRGKMVGGLVAVVALVSAGGFAVSKIASGGDGGASSPNEVGTQLMDALAAEDALGVVDLLLPGERDTLRQPLIDIVDHLERLEIVGSGASLEKVGWLDIEFDGVAVETTETNVDDVSNIHITASSTASIDGDAVPIGDLLIDQFFDGDRPQLDTDAEKSDVDWNLATVKRDGRWYLSTFYSIVENARGGEGDIPESALVADGAGTPEGAVQAMFDAVDDLDLEQLIVTLNPNEAEALQRYAPMFLDEAQSALDDLDATIAFSDVELTATGDGDRRSVAVDGFSMTASAQGDDVTIESRDGCMVITAPDSTTDTCELGGTITEGLGVLGLDDNEELTALVATVRDAFADMKPLGITVQNVGGQWYVSPVGTYLDLYLAVLSALDTNELSDIIDGVKKLIDSFSTEGGLFDVGSGTTIFGDDGSTIDTTDTTGSGADGSESCFSETEYPAYSACLQAGMADGSIDPTSVVPYYRFPECGAGELYWTGDIYAIGDVDFTAFAVAAAPCFQTHIDDGTISEFDLPYELWRPDCLEGKNWYNVTDTDYSNRVFECATA